MLSALMMMFTAMKKTTTFTLCALPEASSWTMSFRKKALMGMPTTRRTSANTNGCT